LGNFPIADLDKETNFWDFSMRLPKGMTMTVNDQKQQQGNVESSLCIFTKQEAGGVSQIVANKFRLDVGIVPGGSRPVTWLYLNVPKFKSDPGDPIKFDTPHMPYAIEMNGLTGARTWKIIEHKADQFQVMVVYRYHVDGWVYVFTGTVTG